MSGGTPHDEISEQSTANGVKYEKDYWSTENLKFAVPHFRMRKVARLVRRIVRHRECDLLDVGCGPSTLARLMPPNVHYYGIDISIPKPAPNLLEVDILESPLAFGDMKFDIVVVQGVFEYLGTKQSQKFAEIAALMNDDGKLVLTYQNFDHRHRDVYPPYSNTQRPTEFRKDLSRFFTIERWFAGAHNWHYTQPRRTLVKLPQAHLNVYVPFISPKLAVDYYYVCLPLR